MTWARHDKSGQPARRNQIAACNRTATESKVIPRELSKFSKKDVQELVARKEPESPRLEYIESVDLGSRDSRKGLLKEVCAFANTAGGDIMIGIRDDGTGASAEALGVRNADGLSDRVTNSIRDSIEPQLVIEPRIIEGFPNGDIVVLRVPLSWARPHRLRPDGAFYRRNGRSSEPMDIMQVRNPFLASGDLAERVKHWRQRRIQRVQGRYGTASGMLVAHAVSLATFDEPMLLQCHDYPYDVLRPVSTSGFTILHNMDGIVAFDKANDRGEYNRYTQVFRNGSFELMCGSVVRDAGPGGRVLDPVALRDTAVNALKVIVATGNHYGLSGPWVVSLCVVGSKGARVLARPTHASGEAVPPLEGDLSLPFVQASHLALEEMLRELTPVWDIVWQSGGASRAPSRD